MTTKKVHQVIQAETVEITPGVFIKRPFPSQQLKSSDPFLLLDHGGPTKVNPAHNEEIPPHPHRGFQPVSLVFQGKVEHRDSLGNHTIVDAGGAQWIHAGSGLLHAEKIHVAPAPDNWLHLVQLWINLPKAHKMDAPVYTNIDPTDIPEAHITDHTRARIIAGEYLGQQGPGPIYSPLVIAHIIAKAGDHVSLPVHEHFAATNYTLFGKVSYQGQSVASTELAVFEDTGNEITMIANEDSETLLLLGKHLSEPVATYGPFVMNHFREIQQAVSDYEQGKMGYLS